MRVAVLWGAGSWRQFRDLVDCVGGCGLVDGSLVDGGLVVGCLAFAYGRGPVSPCDACFTLMGGCAVKIFAALAMVVERRVSDLNAQARANSAWSFATAHGLDEKQFPVLARAAERRVGECKPQGLANTAGAFATAGQVDEKLFAALARAAERRVSEFTARELAGDWCKWLQRLPPEPNTRSVVCLSVKTKKTVRQRLCWARRRPSLSSAVSPLVGGVLSLFCRGTNTVSLSRHDE